MYISSFEVEKKLAETTASEVVPEIMTLLYILRIHFLHMIKFISKVNFPNIEYLNPVIIR